MAWVAEDVAWVAEADPDKDRTFSCSPELLATHARCKVHPSQRVIEQTLQDALHGFFVPIGLHRVIEEDALFVAKIFCPTMFFL